MLATVLAAIAMTAGSSVDGQAINAVRTGDPEAPKTLLVVGQIHGNEAAGRAVAKRLRTIDPPADTQVWTVVSANPDGHDATTRQNARGVDLNRNWPFRWKGGGRAFDTYFPGPAKRSEPETKALQRLIRRIRPDVTLWYHQRLELVTLLPRADNGIIRRYGKAVGLPARRLPNYRGTAVSWQNKTFPASSAFVVELPAGALTAKATTRHARAALATVGDATTTRADAADTEAAPKPEIKWDPIPFGKKRQRQMAAYSKRHYGDGTARLTDPKVIVEHYTAGSFTSAFNTFKANAPDVEFGERPGVCAHFLIDTDGTIRQLVRLKWRCRQTVGLNHRSIGIEHVGYSDGDVIDNKKVLRSSLALTRWLQSRFAIKRRDVIGHAESLGSPYHEEQVPAMKNRTHGDMQPSTMRRYRKRL